MKNKNIKILSLLFSMLIINACGNSDTTDESHSTQPIQEKSSNIKPSVSTKDVVNTAPLLWLKGSWKGDLYYGHREGDLEVSLEYQDDKNIEIFYPKEQCHSRAELNRKEMAIKEISMEGECQKNNFIRLIPIDKHEEYIDDGFETLSDIKLIHIEYTKQTPKDNVIMGMLEKE